MRTTLHSNAKLSPVKVQIANVLAWAKRTTLAGIVGGGCCFAGPFAEAQIPATSPTTSAMAALSQVAWFQQDDQLDINSIEERVFQAAVERVAGSVVQIETIGGAKQVDSITLGNAPTTGIIASEDGYIVTSRFAFTIEPSAILVTLPDGNRIPAKQVAADFTRGLVLLKIESEQPLAVPQGVSRRELEVGQWTIAVGRAFDARTPNVSIGVLSATDRIWGKAVQTDAKISPYNYGGPLIDWQGRIIGVLSPLSNRSSEAIAGTDWYDSGIGFAIPWEDVTARLEQWKQGQDIHPGKLGVTFQGSNLYTDPPRVENVLPTSPADGIGLVSGDLITHVNQKSVIRMAEIRHALGVVDAGQTVELTWQRGDDEFTKQVELAKEIEPYFFSQMGILPAFFKDPDNDLDGVEIKQVVPDSPAAQAGLQQGDRLISIGGQAVVDLKATMRYLSKHREQAPLSIEIQREGELVEKQVGLLPFQTLDSEAIESLISKPIAEGPADAECDVVSIKLPEEETDCFALVPKSSLETPRYRLLIWIPPAGETDRTELEPKWREFCYQYQTIVFIPDSGDRKSWTLTDVDFIRKSTDLLRKQFLIDPNYVACGGVQSGGSLAMLFAFSERDLVRGLVCFDANPVVSVANAESRPNERLLIYTANESSGEKGAIAGFFSQLEKNGHPVTNRKREEASKELSDREMTDLGNWLETLGRF